MTNFKWTQGDFDVFQIEGLDERMQALTDRIRPKFQGIGEVFASYFSTQTGDEFFHHVAKHARRTVNPPKDSWVAFAPYKRGYKALPHFQVGLWGTHLFIVLAIIYEAPQKKEMAERLLQNKEALSALSADYVLSGDHMSPQAVALSAEQIEPLLVRLRDIKKGEFLVGRHISAAEAIELSSEQFMQIVEKTFEDLLPIYKIMANR